MRAEINNTETVEWNNETKSWFFKIINKMDQSLGCLINGKTEKTYKNEITDERREITITSRKIRQL